MADPIREFWGDVMLNLNQLRSHIVDTITSGFVVGPSPAPNPTPTVGRLIHVSATNNLYLGDGTKSE